MRTRKWQDKEGHDRYSTEIVANEMQMLGGRGAGGGGGGQRGGAERSAEPASRGESAPSAEPAGVAENFDDDIPF